MLEGRSGPVLVGTLQDTRILLGLLQGFMLFRCISSVRRHLDNVHTVVHTLFQDSTRAWGPEFGP